MLFVQIPGAQAVLYSKGQYRQSPIFARGHQIFARWGVGFIALKKYLHGTSLPNVRWEEIDGADFDYEALPTGDCNVVLRISQAPKAVS